ncbi:Uncharacterized protein GBIM_10444 [Gryllus bimaculatus]|nr:Uncharacterized protein GBIM_10444 [Gryllus bimaculatus]
MTQAIESSHPHDLIQIKKNVVVPASVDNLPYTTSAEDLVVLASSIRGKDPLPSNSVFADNVKERGLYNSVMAEASKPYVFEPTNATGSSEDESKSSLPSSGGSIEYVLDPASPPDHYSRVQLRGSTSPDWFPGYFQALPSIDGITAVCRDASTVVEEAWSTLQSTMA